MSAGWRGVEEKKGREQVGKKEGRGKGGGERKGERREVGLC